MSSRIVSRLRPLALRARRRTAGQRSSSWSGGPFRDLWLAGTVSDFGFHVTVLALPLTAAITLQASPLQMGILTAVEALPYVVFGLLAGVLVDRLPRRLLLVATDWLRAALLLIVPVLALAGGLNFAVLVVVAIGVGLCSLVFQVAQGSILPSLVDRDRLADANARMEASFATAQATGPGLAGILVGALSAPLAITVNALTFAVSGLILRRLPAAARVDAGTGADDAAGPETPLDKAGTRQTPGDIVADVRDGLRVLFGQPVLRASLLASSTVNLFGYVFMAVYLIFMARTLGLSAVTIGLILSAGGVGAVVGAVVSEPLRRRLGFGQAMVWSMAVCSACSLLIPAALVVPSVAVPLLAIAEFAQYGALAIFNIGGRTLRQTFAPDHYQGRVNATARTLASVGTLVGSLGGGLLGSWIGLGPTLVIGAIGMMLATPVALLSPLRSLRTLPDPATQSGPDQPSVGAPVTTSSQ